MTRDPVDDAIDAALGLPEDPEPDLAERARARRKHRQEKTR